MIVTDFADFPLTDEQFVEYANGLQVDERVVETNRTAFFGKFGTVYISQNPGPALGTKCVLWDAGRGIGKMGTSVTAGTRRVTDADPYKQGHWYLHETSSYEAAALRLGLEHGWLNVVIRDSSDSVMVDRVGRKRPAIRWGTLRDADPSCIQPWPHNRQLPDWVPPIFRGYPTADPEYVRRGCGFLFHEIDPATLRCRHCGLGTNEMSLHGS